MIWRVPEVLEAVLWEAAGQRLPASALAGSVLHAAAVKSGMITLYQDGMKKAEAGLTTAEEVERICTAGSPV